MIIAVNFLLFKRKIQIRSESLSGFVSGYSWTKRLLFGVKNGILIHILVPVGGTSFQTLVHLREIDIPDSVTEMEEDTFVGPTSRLSATQVTSLLMMTTVPSPRPVRSPMPSASAADMRSDTIPTPAQ